MISSPEEVSIMYKIISGFIGILGVAGTSGSVWFWHDKKAKDAKLSDLEKSINFIANKQTEHDTKFVTDQRVRDIVKDEIKPLRDDVTDVKSKTSEIYTTLNDVVTELKISNAIRNYEKEIKKRTTDI